jgi:hypothetical protein
MQQVIPYDRSPRHRNSLEGKYGLPIWRFWIPYRITKGYFMGPGELTRVDGVDLSLAKALGLSINLSIPLSYTQEKGSWFAVVFMYSLLSPLIYRLFSSLPQLLRDLYPSGYLGFVTLDFGGVTP